MPFKAPESYELDRPDSPLMNRHSLNDDDSDLSDVDELDPLKRSQRPYTDDASQPIRSVFDSEKNASFSKTPLAWLDGQRKQGTWKRFCIPTRFCCMLILLFVATLVLLLSAGGIWVYKAAVPLDGQSDPWYPSPKGGTVEAWKEAYEKAAKLVGDMTLVEKVNMTTGVGWSMGLCVGNTGPVPRLGFPSLCLQDGPLGLRFADNITAFPAGITVGATWNKTLMYERGKAHGFEAKKKGVHVILGPSMGPLGRLPAGGRTWEGFGSDPVLQGIAAAETIKGIQDAGVIATAKHYVANEQEHFRQAWEWGIPNAISSNIDDRTMHEVYAWPFADSVRAGVASVMCSYNQVNNSYACQNSKLMNGVLKDELGFQGFIQSDWLAQRSGVAAALAGLDMTMPGDGLGWADGKSLWGPELTTAVLNTSMPMDRLNDMALRIASAWYQLGQDDDEEWPSNKEEGQPTFSSWTDDEMGELHPGSPDSKENEVVNKFVPVRNTEEGGDHNAIARQVAREGIVMVKNEDSILPLSRNGTASETSGGKFKVGIFGEDAFPNPKGPNACKDRNCNEYTLASGWGSGAVELPYLVAPAEALHANFDSQSVELSNWEKNSIDHVEATAADQDLCLVFISSDAGEGFTSWNGVRGDRNDLRPQKGGDKLVRRVASNCPNTVVVLHTVGPTILEEFIELPGVKAVLVAHLPGQESGNALADVLFGDHNPDGHLPYTIAKSEADYGPTSGIMYYPNAVVPQQDFTEGLYIDYRYLNAHDIEPRYPFGWGLSYVDWNLNSLFVHNLGMSANNTPSARPEGLQPPAVETQLPDPESAAYPENFNPLKKYIYPYLSSPSSVTKGQYPYPTGYGIPRTPSEAGGGEGGNPDLYTPAVSVQATLTNLGSIPGAQVVQAYISFPPNLRNSLGEAVDTPPRVLRAWDKIYLDPRVMKKGKVDLELTRRDLSFWDTGLQNWVVPEGEFGVWLAFSSGKAELEGRFEGRVSLGAFGGGVGRGR